MRTKTTNLRSKALDLLTRREHSYKELYNKLAKFSDDYDAIKEVLNEMIEKKYLSEERYIESFISAKSKKYGVLKIKHALGSKVSDQDLVNQIYQDANIDELNNACNILRRKYNQIPEDIQSKAKVIRFLLNRGFAYSIATQAIKVFNISEEICD